MRRTLSPLITILFCLCSSLSSNADGYSTKKTINRSPQEVFVAAERAASRIGARIQQRDPAHLTLVFASGHSGFRETYSGYHAVFTVDPQQKSGKTIVHLRASGIMLPSPQGPPLNGQVVGSQVARRFFAALKQELGLCHACKPSEVNGGAGLKGPRLRNTTSAFPN